MNIPRTNTKPEEKEYNAYDEAVAAPDDETEEQALGLDNDEHLMEESSSLG